VESVPAESVPAANTNGGHGYARNGNIPGRTPRPADEVTMDLRPARATECSMIRFVGPRRRNETQDDPPLEYVGGFRSLHCANDAECCTGGTSNFAVCSYSVPDIHSQSSK